MTARTARGEDIFLIGEELRALMDLTVPLSEMHYLVTSVESLRPLRTASRCLRAAPAVMVVMLNGDENVADVRSVLSACVRTRCLFLVEDLPPRAALARVVSTYGSTILGKDECAAVVASTLVALLARPAEVVP